MGTRRVVGRRRRGGWNRLVVLAGLGGFVVGVYVVVVLGGGALIGHTESPNLALSVIATATVALLFSPVQSAIERHANSRAWAGRTTGSPYDALRRVTDSVATGYATDELPGRMSMLLAQGTGAQWAQVWLQLSGRLTLAATWPPHAEADGDPPTPGPDGWNVGGDGRRIMTVTYAGQLLGVLRLRERPGSPLTAVEQRLFAGLAAQAGLVLRLIGLRAALEGRRVELLARAAELAESRQRLIETQDAERRRLERDIHDGAQQHLVALAVNLRLAQTIATRSPERAALVLHAQADAAEAAIENLASLSRGIYPRLLAHEGLVPALRAAVASSPIPVSIEAVGVGRLPAPVETALYFCCLESMQNAAKHSGANRMSVQVRDDPDRWRATIVDDGSGFPQARIVGGDGGGGLANMRDRLDALGGIVTVTSMHGRGTTVAAEIEKRTAAVAPVPTTAG